MPKLKLGVLISGRGSNLQALISACSAPQFPAEIALVISNRADAKGLELAKKAGITTEIINHKAFKSRNAFDDAVSKALSNAGVKLVCLAGFMLLLQDRFVAKWQNQIINPSLLPAFRGLDVHERVVESGVRISGCTVHYVRPAVDDGPIIVQAAVAVLPGDTPESLADRILQTEHQLYPMAVEAIATGRAKVEDDIVVFDEAVTAAPPLVSPPLKNH